MKYVFVYSQLDLEDLDVYIVGVFSNEKDAVDTMNKNIKEYAERHKELNYDTSKDSNGVSLNKAAKSFSFYLENKLRWEIHAEILDFDYS